VKFGLQERPCCCPHYGPSDAPTPSGAVQCINTCPRTHQAAQSTCRLVGICKMDAWSRQLLTTSSRGATGAHPHWILSGYLFLTWDGELIWAMVLHGEEASWAQQQLNGAVQGSSRVVDCCEKNTQQAQPFSELATLHKGGVGRTSRSKKQQKIECIGSGPGRHDVVGWCVWEL